MLVKISELKRTIKAKGKVVSVDDAGIQIMDSKTEEISILTYDVFKMFMGKEISFSVADSEKDEEAIEEIGSDEE